MFGKKKKKSQIPNGHPQGINGYGPYGGNGYDRQWPWVPVSNGQAPRHHPGSQRPYSGPPNHIPVGGAPKSALKSKGSRHDVPSGVPNGRPMSNGYHHGPHHGMPLAPQEDKYGRVGHTNQSSGRSSGSDKLVAEVQVNDPGKPSELYSVSIGGLRGDSLTKEMKRNETLEKQQMRKMTELGLVQDGGSIEAPPSYSSAPRSNEYSAPPQPQYQPAPPQPQYQPANDQHMYVSAHDVQTAKRQSRQSDYDTHFLDYSGRPVGNLNQGQDQSTTYYNPPPPLATTPYTTPSMPPATMNGHYSNGSAVSVDVKSGVYVSDAGGSQPPQIGRSNGGSSIHVG